MKNLIFCILIILGLIIPAAVSAKKPAEQITYLEHQKGVNKIICEKHVECKKTADAGSCTQRLNGVTEANPFNKTTMVLKPKSDKCHKALNEATCENITAKSIEGPCSLDNLTK